MARASAVDPEFDSFPDDQEGVDALNEQAAIARSQPSSRSLTLRGRDFSERTITTETLKGLSFADLESLGIAASDISEETDQFGSIVSKDKDPLVGVPFVALYWEFNKGTFANDFVSVYVLTQDDRRFILNDGGTGICAQLHYLTDKKGITSMLACRKGLRRSDYEAHPSKDGSGRMIPAGTTYYIDDSL